LKFEKSNYQECENQQKYVYGGQIWDLRTRVYGGQTPITHSLDNLVSLANDIIYTKIFKNPKLTFKIVNILIIWQTFAESVQGL
jgi:hypothetical protein